MTFDRPMAKPKPARSSQTARPRPAPARAVDRPNDPDRVPPPLPCPPRRNAPLLIASAVAYAGFIAFLLWIALKA